MYSFLKKAAVEHNYKINIYYGYVNLSDPSNKYWTFATTVFNSYFELNFNQLEDLELIWHHAFDYLIEKKLSGRHKDLLEEAASSEDVMDTSTAETIDYEEHKLVWSKQPIVDHEGNEYRLLVELSVFPTKQKEAY